MSLGHIQMILISTPKVNSPFFKYFTETIGDQLQTLIPLLIQVRCLIFLLILIKRLQIMWKRV